MYCIMYLSDKDSNHAHGGRSLKSLRGMGAKNFGLRVLVYSFEKKRVSLKHKVAPRLVMACFTMHIMVL